MAPPPSAGTSYRSSPPPGQRRVGPPAPAPDSARPGDVHRARRLAIRRLPGLTANERGLLHVLADWADAAGVCWPGLDTLAGETSLHRVTVIRLLAGLEAKGLLTSTHERGRTRSNRYVLTLPPAPEKVAPRDVLSPAGAAQNVAPRSENVAPSAAKRCRVQPELVQGTREIRGATPPLTPPEPAAPPHTQHAKREPDPLWEAVVEVCGEPATKSERGATNRAVGELREANATPEDVRRRAAEYRRRWPNASLTPSALAKHWGKMGRPEPQPPPRAAKYGTNGPARGTTIDVQNRLVDELTGGSAAPALPAPQAPRQEVA